MARTKSSPNRGRSALTTGTAHRAMFVSVANSNASPRAQPASPPDHVEPAAAKAGSTQRAKISPKDSAAKSKSKKDKSKQKKKHAQHGLASAKSATSTHKGLHKVRRFHPGTVALRQIKKLQADTRTLIPAACFHRIVRECMGELGTAKDPPMRFRREALSALQEGLEANTLQFLESANLAAIHGKRVTLMPKDLSFIRRVAHN